MQKRIIFFLLFLPRNISIGYRYKSAKAQNGMKHF